MFLDGRKPKTTVFTMFFASGIKKHGIYSVFWLAPSKNTGIYGGFTMEENVVSWSEKNKHTVNYNVLSLLLGCVGGVFFGRGGGVLKWLAISWIIR